MDIRTDGDIHWPAIRARYEARAVGFRLLVRQLHAEGLVISHEAVRRRARAEGWGRSLRPSVRRGRALALSGAEMPATTVVTGIPEPEARAAIQSEIARSGEVIRQHRAAIARDMMRLNRIVWAIDAALQIDPPITAAEIGMALEALERLARVRERLIRLERQAFGIGNAAGDEHAARANLTVEQKGALVAALGVRLAAQARP